MDLPSHLIPQPPPSADTKSSWPQTTGLTDAEKEDQALYFSHKLDFSTESSAASLKKKKVSIH